MLKGSADRRGRALAFLGAVRWPITTPTLKVSYSYMVCHRVRDRVLAFDCVILECIILGMGKVYPEIRVTFGRRTDNTGPVYYASVLFHVRFESEFLSFSFVH